METSVYTIAFAVKNSSIPYRYCIESWLPVADEVWVACDPQWDDPSIFTEIDPKVKVVEIEFDVSRFDMHAEMAASARASCTGDWCLFLGLDESFYGASAGRLRVLLESIKSDEIQAVRVGYVQPRAWGLSLSYPSWTVVRTRVIRNLPNITHGTDLESTMVDFEYQHWDGRYAAESIDDVEYMDSNTGKVPVLKEHLVVDNIFLDLVKEYNATIEAALESLDKYIYIQHNKPYSLERLSAVHAKQSPWWDRWYGRRVDFDIDAYYQSLKEPVGSVFIPKQVEVVTCQRPLDS